MLLLHDQDGFEAHDKGADAANVRDNLNILFPTLGEPGRQNTIFGRGPKQTKPLAGRVRWTKWWSASADKTREDLGKCLLAWTAHHYCQTNQAEKKNKKHHYCQKTGRKKGEKNITTAGASDRIKLFAKWKTSKSGKSDFWPRNQNFKELPKSESFSLKKVTSARGHPGTVTWEHGQL